MEMETVLGYLLQGAMIASVLAVGLNASAADILYLWHRPVHGMCLHVRLRGASAGSAPARGYKQGRPDRGCDAPSLGTRCACPYLGAVGSTWSCGGWFRDAHLRQHILDR